VRLYAESMTIETTAEIDARSPSKRVPLPERGLLERRHATNTVELSIRSVGVVIAMVLATLATIWLLLQIRGVLTWIVVSTFFAVVLTPPVNFLNHRVKMRRGLAAALVFITAIAIFTGLIYAFVRPIVSQTTLFVEELPTQVAEARRGEGPVGDLVRKYDVEGWAERNQAKLRENVQELGTNALSVVQSVFSTLFAVLTVAVLTVLLLMQGPSLMRSGIGLLSPPQQERMLRIGRDSAKAITGYVAGNLLISIIAGISTWVFLTIVGVPFAGVLALWVAFADLIPLVGATMGAIPTVAVAFLHSVPAGIAAAIFYTCYQQFENHLLQPTIMSKAVSIRPLVVMVSVLSGVELFGILGALLAIPVAGVVKVIGTEILRVRRPELMQELDDQRAAKEAESKANPGMIGRLTSLVSRT
jgi:predicted PurR-regulated permease PerM